ncbi:alpha/beta fold hydrolase [Streptomyces sp. NBC_01381]|uniref:alpha/beta hydrolase family protein n=1 Tax=Streptomyces sp. NBC_01381 TaxID=2903845 RepID=UPI00225A9D67|nr:alpha/beta fold hydrolase [Streptomyces sp. NBC_01381]MCX4667677.1 alpha/beta fold hydrolase [Streptomyces sp. NBC_01381]
MTQQESASEQPPAAGRAEQGGELPLLVTVQLPDGARFPVRALRGEKAPDGPAPAVLILPAMGTPARYYRAFARQLHAEGLTALTVDLRGQGESTPRVTDAAAVEHGYGTIVEQDLVAVVDAIRAELGAEPPLFLLGHSLGGQLGLVHAALGIGPGVDGVALVASGSVWFRAYGRLRGPLLLLGQLFAAAASTLLGRWPGVRLGFGGNQPKGVMRDWARQGRTGRYSAAGSTHDYEAALRTLDLPVLAVSVEGDTWAPAPALDHLVGKVPGARVTRIRYSRQEAGGRLDHFAWTRAGGALAKRVAAWAGPGGS